MSELRPPGDLVRQAQHHLDSLRAAGVEWLPLAAEPLNSPPSAETILPQGAPVLHAAQPEGLFAMSEEKPSLSPDERRHALQVLTQEVARCARCPELAATRTQTVFGVGRMDPDVCFIGEAPGADEDAQGEPFVGAAGQLLNRIIAACGMQRGEVYICNILRCRPPGNRLPLPNEAANCREYLDRTLELIRPKFICCLGGCAAQNLLGTQLSVGKLRGRFHDYRGTPVLVTYHPAYLLRNPSSKREVWEDMKALLARMGRPVPQR
jgi:uracil-DNA glycosylase